MIGLRHIPSLIIAQVDHLPISYD